ncbi:MAG TPA: hypothetical protein VKM54_15900 [Myxococcota bacterium]|nr:hypothetical protein [Myxococcota bacterium]
MPRRVAFYARVFKIAGEKLAAVAAGRDPVEENAGKARSLYTQDHSSSHRARRQQLARRAPESSSEVALRSVT